MQSRFRKVTAKKLRLWGQLILGAGVVCSHQACTPASFLATPPATSTSHAVSARSGGEGFDGKVYANFGTCANGGLDVVAKIRIADDGNSASVLRENCQDQNTPPVIDISELDFPVARGEVFKWRERIFDLVTAAATQRTTLAICESIETTMPFVQALIWQEANDILKLHGTVANGSSILINDSLINAPLSSSAPVDFSSSGAQPDAMALSIDAVMNGSLSYSVASGPTTARANLKCTGQPPPIKVVQQQARAATFVGGSQHTLAINQTGTGNLLVIGMTFAAGATSPCATSIQDNAQGGSNTYVSANVPTTDVNAGPTEIWYAANTRPGATTITLNSCGSNPTLFVAEVSGMALSNPLDGAAALSNQPVRTNFLAPVVSTTLPRSFVFSVLGEGAVLTSPVTGNQFTFFPVVSWDNAAYFIAGAPGTYGAVWFQDPTTTYGSGTAIFKPRW